MNADESWLGATEFPATLYAYEAHEGLADL